MLFSKTNRETQKGNWDISSFNWEQLLFFTATVRKEKRLSPFFHLLLLGNLEAWVLLSRTAPPLLQCIFLDHISSACSNTPTPPQTLALFSLFFFFLLQLCFQPGRRLTSTTACGSDSWQRRGSCSASSTCKRTGTNGWSCSTGASLLLVCVCVCVRVRVCQEGKTHSSTM